MASIADTRTVLLDVAEKLLAQCGVEGVSIRDIANDARANFGAVNYHFESKDILVLEVFVRRIEPVNRDRIRWIAGRGAIRCRRRQE